MKWILLVFVGLALGIAAIPASRDAILKVAVPLVETIADRGASVSERLNPFAEEKSPLSGKFPLSRSFRDHSREWTFVDGSRVEGYLVAANAETAQFRLADIHGVGEVPLRTLAQKDRERIEGWIASEGTDGVAGLPISLKNHQWPRQWGGKDTEVSLQQTPGTNRWKSRHFDITNEAGVSAEALQSITMICEAVDGALSSLPLPLPLNWGRAPDELREIVIEDSPATEGVVAQAGYWDGRTGIVHIHADFLVEPDLQLVVFEFDKPEKAQRYDVIVHEVTHQSMGGLMYLGVPAWVPEGIAEYMAATQYAPGAYFFDNTHVALRHHINRRLLGDRIVKNRRMNLVRLEKLMNRGLAEWNEIVATGDVAGYLQYNEALLVIDYFFHRDHPHGAHFRRYLEAILGGLPEPEARRHHLLRGRSYQQIEREIHELWRPLGFTINFQDRGELQAGDVSIDWGAEGVKRTIASRRAAMLDTQ